MARFHFPLTRSGRRLALAGILTLGTTGALLHAQNMMMDEPAKTPAPKAVAAPAAKTPGKNGAAPAQASAKPAAAPLPELDVDRYGKILGPSDEPAHPVRLNSSFIGIGQLKVPSANEVAMRQKLEALATLSDQEIRTQLAAWPAFSKMSLADEGAMLTRIQQFRENRLRVAQMRAHELGLSTLTPAQMTRFETEYWNRQLQLDQELAKQFEPVYKDRETKLEQDLFREFSSVAPAPVAAAPKPVTTVKPAAPKPAAPKPALTAANIPSVTSTAK
jgi:hypothetical protein